ncbi:MAG: RNA polymerase Rpb4 [Desulfurococcaceae archaeon]
MSTPLRIKAESVKLLSNTEALNYLREYSERLRRETGTTSLLSSRVLEYLSKFSKLPAEKTNEFREKLNELGLKEGTVVMIMNICPKNLDELRPLLILEEKTPEPAVLDKVIDLAKEYCLERE